MIINFFIILIFLLSIVYTFKYKFIQLHFIKYSKQALKNKTSKSAFFLSLGSHIGAGNILGVTSGLVLGGPGVLFWMVICTIFTSIFSLIENTMGLKYQVLIENERRGGSPYYILLGAKKKYLSIVFSIILVLSSTIFFLPIQVNGVVFSIKNLFNIDDFYILILLLLFAFVFIFRGTKTITKIIDIIVPIMTVFFLIICLYAVIINLEKIPYVLSLIVKDAFTFKSGSISVILIGLKRSLFSNEAGLGTAPSINCYSNNKPLNQGYLQVLTCFIDTIVMCVLLGFVILLYNINLDVNNSDELSIFVFQKIFKIYGRYIGNILLFIFSFATIISGYYAGETNILFNSLLRGNSSEAFRFIYKMLFIIGIFLGIYVKNQGLWNLVDLGLILLGVINIFIIIKLRSSFEEEILMKT